MNEKIANEEKFKIMEKILIVFIHVFLLTLWLYNMLKFGKRIRKKRKNNNNEHIEDVFEKALFDIAIISLLMYVAMMCLVSAIAVIIGKANKETIDEK